MNENEMNLQVFFQLKEFLTLTYIEWMKLLPTYCFADRDFNKKLNGLTTQMNIPNSFRQQTT